MPAAVQMSQSDPAAAADATVDRRRPLGKPCERPMRRTTPKPYCVRTFLRRPPALFPRRRRQCCPCCLRAGEVVHGRGRVKKREGNDEEKISGGRAGRRQWKRGTLGRLRAREPESGIPRGRANYGESGSLFLWRYALEEGKTSLPFRSALPRLLWRFAPLRSERRAVSRFSPYFCARGSGLVKPVWMERASRQERKISASWFVRFRRR